MPARFSAYAVDPDITVASTLPGRFYQDETAYAASLERIFAQTWQWLELPDQVLEPGSLAPVTLLPGSLDEPLLLARDAGGTLRCLSNVCTHRGNILVHEPCRAEQIRCGYHSRRFDLAGRMCFMPEFSAAKNFPRPEDHLPQLRLNFLGPVALTSLRPAALLADFLGDIPLRLRWLPLEEFRLDPARSRDYEVAAHWALYVENYLEGFHIPFVHAGLNQLVDYGSYRSTLFRQCNVQVAFAKPGESAFDPPPESPEHGQRVAAYYYWIFPNLMLNFYPWGLSLNHVQPLGLDRCRVAFRSYVWDESKLDTGAGGALDQVEMEDEAVVEAVQRGVRSRLYGRGRYSPTREQGVHHFHRLLVEFLNAE